MIWLRVGLGMGIMEVGCVGVGMVGVVHEVVVVGWGGVNSSVVARAENWSTEGWSTLGWCGWRG